MTTVSTNTFPGNPLTGLPERVQDMGRWMQRETATVKFRVQAVALMLIALWGAAIAVFGYPALIGVALAMVPVMFTVLMLITVGK